MEFTLSTPSARVEGTEVDLQDVVVLLSERSTTKVGADGHSLTVGTGHKGGEVVLTFRGMCAPLKQLWLEPDEATWGGHIVDNQGRRFDVQGGVRTNRPGFSTAVKFHFPSIA